MQKQVLGILLCWLAISAPVSAQLSITALNTASEINFDQDVPGVVNTRFSALGIGPTPTLGQLDSDGWSILGVLDTNSSIPFGGTATDPVYSRGGSAGGITTGGIYAFGIAVGDTILGMQPTQTVMTPGHIRLKVVNNTGTDINRVVISYDVLVRNDQARSNSLNFSYSTDNVNFTNVPAADFASPLTADVTPAWVATNRAVTFDLPISVPNGGEIYLNWRADDNGGGGSRDEMGLNNISVEFQYIVPPVIPVAVWAEMTSSNTAWVAFDVPVSATGEQVANYTFGQGSALSTATATRNATHDTVSLTLIGSLTPGVIDTLFVSAVESEATNSPQAQPDTFLLWFNGTVPSLVITELMYNDPSSADVLEYIEIMNTGSTNAELGSLVFMNGVGGALPVYSLAPNDVVVVSAEAFTSQFASFFGFTPDLTFTGDLANAGETIVLVNSLGDTVIDFTYGTSGDWPAEPNHGSAYMAAFTLHICDPLNATPYNPCNWSYSADFEGMYDDGIGNQDEVYASPGFLGEGTCFAELDANTLPICPEVANQFFADMAGDDATEGNYSYLWSFGSTLMEPFYTPTLQDSLLTVTVTRGNCTFSEELALEVVNLRVNVMAMDTTDVNTFTAEFAVLNPLAGQTFNWTFTCGSPNTATGAGPHTIYYPISKTSLAEPCPWTLNVSNQGCSYIYVDTIFHDIGSGANEALLRNSLTAYPNPTTDAVRVAFSLNAPQAVNITVTDLTGRVVLRESLTPSGTEVETELNLSHLPTGLYNVTVQPASGETATMRVVRN